MYMRMKTRTNSWSVAMTKHLYMNRVQFKVVNGFKNLGATLSKDSSSITYLH